MALLRKNIFRIVEVELEGVKSFFPEMSVRKVKETGWFFKRKYVEVFDWERFDENLTYINGENKFLHTIDKNKLVDKSDIILSFKTLEEATSFVEKERIRLEAALVEHVKLRAKKTAALTHEGKVHEVLDSPSN